VKFLGIGGPATPEGPLDSLYALARRVRNADTEAELVEIEQEIDNVLKAERVKYPRWRRERGGRRYIERGKPTIGEPHSRSPSHACEETGSRLRA